MDKPEPRPWSNSKKISALVAVAMMLALISVIAFWPSLWSYGVISVWVIFVAYHFGYQAGWSKALKLAYDSERGEVCSDSEWGSAHDESYYSYTRIFESNLRSRLENGGATCARCGWKSGHKRDSGLSFYRYCAVCFARIGKTLSSDRYILIGTGPFCKLHFDEANRIALGELSTYTWNHKSQDEWSTGKASS
jgi:hypothetical protein